MRISRRKYAITGASRGLGAALAIVMADAGAKLVLLARTKEALHDTAHSIQNRTGQDVEALSCDLADHESCTLAGARLAQEHADLDGLIHNGAMWLPGSMHDISDVDIHACIASAAIGSLILTRHLLPNLLARQDADIHTVVSTSGLPNRPLDGGSVAFHAAKFAQAGFIQGLANELAKTRVRVTAVFPGDFPNISPTDAMWNAATRLDQTLSTRQVVEAILFILNQPSAVSVKSLIIE
jgi:short-subunit dehydrogenase